MEAAFASESRSDLGQSSAEEIWTLLRTLFGQHRRRFLIGASQLDLHPAQAGMLLQLESPLPMSELATRLVCDSSNVTGLVDRLETRGLVERRPHDQDRRVKLVALTADGRRVRDRMLEQINRPVPGLDRLSTDEQHQLYELLRRMVQSADGG